jgi:glutathione S-transferase
MKLYFATGACSLADRIALHEAKLAASFEKVDLKTKTTESGADFMTVNPKGYVPVLMFDDGKAITENIAILFWVASHATELAPGGPLGQVRLLEALAYISTEIHKSFTPFFARSAPEKEKADAAQALSKRFEYFARNLNDGYLFGRYFSVADAYLFVTLRWAKKFGVPLPDELDAYFQRIMARDAVRQSLTEEGLSEEKLALPQGA